MPLRPTARPVSKLCPWSDGRPRPSKAQIAPGLLLLAGCLMTSAGYPTQSPSASTEFTNPQRVTMRGYSDHAMEPFLTRDGKYLFFNNSNDPQANTNLHWAERIDDLTFQYKGEIAGVNSAALEGVPSMDREGIFYFVSTRSYNQTASTIYLGKFVKGAISDIELAPGISTSTPGIVNFDSEISGNGKTLYFVESQFTLAGRPKTARILMARRMGNSFHRDLDSATILQPINTDTLNYAPATSLSEVEMFFTRLDADGPAIYTANRPTAAAQFGTPRKIRAITGFAEAPTLSPDEKSLYYHKKEKGRFVIYRVTR